MEQPKVYVGIHRDEFDMACNYFGWVPCQIKYVHVSEVDTQLLGYYAEDIYPPIYGSDRPSRHKSPGPGEQ